MPAEMPALQAGGPRFEPATAHQSSQHIVQISPAWLAGVRAPAAGAFPSRVSAHSSRACCDGLCSSYRRKSIRSSRCHPPQPHSQRPFSCSRFRNRFGWPPKGAVRLGHESQVCSLSLFMAMNAPIFRRQHFTSVRWPLSVPNRSARVAGHSLHGPPAFAISISFSQGWKRERKRNVMIEAHWRGELRRGTRRPATCAT